MRKPSLAYQSAKVLADHVRRDGGAVYLGEHVPGVIPERARI
jgi:hypothetical protein